MNRSHTEIAGPSSRRIPRLIGMSFRSAIPGELHSCIARFRFADQNHSATNGAKCNRIQRKEVSPLAFVSMAGFSLIVPIPTLGSSAPGESCQIASIERAVCASTSQVPQIRTC